MSIVLIRCCSQIRWFFNLPHCNRLSNGTPTFFCFGTVQILACPIYQVRIYRVTQLIYDRWRSTDFTWLRMAKYNTISITQYCICKQVKLLTRVLQILNHWCSKSSQPIYYCPVIYLRLYNRIIRTIWDMLNLEREWMVWQPTHMYRCVINLTADTGRDSQAFLEDILWWWVLLLGFIHFTSHYIQDFKNKVYWVGVCLNAEMRLEVTYQILLGKGAFPPWLYILACLC